MTDDPFDGVLVKFALLSLGYESDAAVMRGMVLQADSFEFLMESVTVLLVSQFAEKELGFTIVEVAFDEFRDSRVDRDLTVPT